MLGSGSPPPQPLWSCPCLRLLSSSPRKTVFNCALPTKGKHFYSSSESEEEEESHRKFNIKIKPLQAKDILKNAATVDELKASVGNIALSPSPVVSGVLMLSVGDAGWRPCPPACGDWAGQEPAAQAAAGAQAVPRALLSDSRELTHSMPHVLCLPKCWKGCTESLLLYIPAGTT